MDLIHNERIKLFATYLNGLAVAVSAVGGLAPLFSLLYGTIPASLAGFVILLSGSCLGISAALHWTGSVILKRLKP